MTEPEKPQIEEIVKIGGRGLTDDERVDVQNATAQYEEANASFYARLGAMGYEIDASMEAYAHMLWFFNKIGLLTDDQYLAIKASWQATFHKQLRTLIRKAEKAQGGGLATPPQGLIVPPTNGRPRRKR